MGRRKPKTIVITSIGLPSDRSIQIMTILKLIQKINSAIKNLASVLKFLCQAFILFQILTITYSSEHTIEYKTKPIWFWCRPDSSFGLEAAALE